jgi:dTMP kinase
MGRSRAPKSGVFITLEGIEGCGKSTQAKRLAAHLRKEGHRTTETREPGGTAFAERIRALLLGPASEPITSECEALLMCASRSQHVARVIRPALSRGETVICDRFSDSTLAYQGYGRGLDIKALAELNRFTTGGLTPDLTLVLDLPVAAGLARRHRERDLNRLDREAHEFYRRVREGYLKLAVRSPRRIKVLDAAQDAATVETKIVAVVEQYLNQRLKVGKVKVRKPRKALSHES